MEAALQGKRLTIRYVYDEYQILPPPLFFPLALRSIVIYV